MTFRQFLSVLLARRKLFLAFFFGTVILVVGISLLIPKKYTAVASVVVDVKPDPLSPYGYQSMLAPTLMATQAEIITSDRVARRVVRSLKLAENPAIREQWQSEMDGKDDIETWLISLFMNYLDVKPGRESNAHVLCVDT
eukprot:Opistho-2@43345